MIIKVNPQERIGLENVLAVQQGKPRDLRVVERVLDKIETTPAFRREYLRQLPGGAEWDMDAVVLGEISEVDLETEECHKALELLDEWPGFAARDRSWRRPLRDKIRAALDDVTKRT